jgi:hypothetical protein
LDIFRDSQGQPRARASIALTQGASRPIASSIQPNEGGHDNRAGVKDDGFESDTEVLAQRLVRFPSAN